MKTLICEQCGNTYIATRASQKYCSDECRLIVIKERGRLYNDKHRQKEKIDEQKKAKDAIGYINEKARESGMSYGQYRAKLMLKNMPKINTELANELKVKNV
ncbi:MAG: hypothetical protein PHW03_05815 [Eubacteriales bacterium]|nr:hypothetical protein [Eubacteriales bacterium]MDD4390303.1 hypothetical protein [Eubacteriales bacterium]